MKIITIISYSFPPSNAPAAQRPYTIAKYLAETGMIVDVITCSNPDSSLGISDGFSNNLKFKVYKIPGISLKWFRKVKRKQMAGTESKTSTKVNKQSSSNLSKWVFPDKAISWFPGALIYCLFHPKLFNNRTVLTTSPLATNHLLGLLVKMFFNLDWIADVRDFHYLNNFDQTPNTFNSKLQGWLEKKVITKANVVSFISESMRNLYSQAYPEYASKFKAIYNGFDPEDFEQSIIDEKTFNILPIKIFYAGSFYKGLRSPIPFLQALQFLIDSKIISQSDITIEIAGNFEKELLENIKTFSVSNQIKFLGLLPRDAVLKKMQTSHLLWLIIGEQTSHSAGIPVKAFEYIGARRPILCFGPEKTETTNLIEELNAGWILSNHESALDDNVKILTDIFKNNLFSKIMDEKSNNNLDKYNRKFQAYEFLEFIR